MCQSYIILYRYCGHISFRLKKECEFISKDDVESCNLQYRYSAREMDDGCPSCHDNDGLAATFAMRKYMETQIEGAAAGGDPDALTVKMFRRQFETSWLSRWRRGSEDDSGKKDEPLWHDDVTTIGWFRRTNKLRTYQETEPRFIHYWTSWLAKRAPPAPPEGNSGASTEENGASYEEWKKKRYDMYSFTKWVKEEISECKCAWGPARVVAKQHFWEWMEWRKKGRKGNPPVGKPRWLDEEEYYSTRIGKDVMEDPKGKRRIIGMRDDGRSTSRSRSRRSRNS